jgi:outer membrane protein assembly factor BamB
MNRIVWPVVLLSVAMLGVGCERALAPEVETPAYAVPLSPDSPWPKFRRNGVQNARGTALANDGAGEPWTFRTGKGIFSSPIVGGDGTVFIGSADRSFYALNGEDGAIAWSFPTGEIIDSAGLLDDQGRLFFGSGDGHLYALDATTGTEIWTFAADDPSGQGAFINWFEGNVAIGPSGELYIPNDNFLVYAINPETGEPRWSFRMTDQTWSLPAVDVDSGRLFIGNNNLLSARGDNTFAINIETGESVWSASIAGTVAASPLLAGDRMIVGGFDGYVRAFDVDDGHELWSFATRDHVYASASELSDGTIVVPSADGTLYALDPATGTQRWAFDTREPIRSSPAVGGDDVIYFGGGDGRLYAVNPDGSLRWAMQLVSGDRNDLNSSPALSHHAVVIASESGEVFSVPLDWCLTDGSEDNKCVAGPEEDLPVNGANLRWTSRWGSVQASPPASLSPGQPVVLALFVREDGDTRLALIDDATVDVVTSPEVALSVEVSADRRFLTIVPEPTFPLGVLEVQVSADWLHNPDREGLRFTGGQTAGRVEFRHTFAVAGSSDAELPVLSGGDTIWEMSRLAAPMPTILPSYNQIGFDSLHWLVTMVEDDGVDGVAWVVGAVPGEDGISRPEPGTGNMFATTVHFDSGALVLDAKGGMGLEVMSAKVDFDRFRIAGQLDSTGEAVGGADVTASSNCGDVPLYGAFMRSLGFCNPTTDVLHATGGVLLHPVPRPSAPSVGPVTWERDGDRITAVVDLPDNSTTSILAVDVATGAPVPLPWGLGTQIESGQVTIEGPLPASVRAYLMVDTTAVASANL